MTPNEQRPLGRRLGGAAFQPPDKRRLSRRRSQGDGVPPPRSVLQPAERLPTGGNEEGGQESPPSCQERRHPWRRLTTSHSKIIGRPRRLVPPSARPPRTAGKRANGPTFPPLQKAGTSSRRASRTPDARKRAPRMTPPSLPATSHHAGETCPSLHLAAAGCRLIGLRHPDIKHGGHHDD